MGFLSRWYSSDPFQVPTLSLTCTHITGLPPRSSSHINISEEILKKETKQNHKKVPFFP